jgi:hypothetical protein
MRGKVLVSGIAGAAGQAAAFSCEVERFDPSLVTSATLALWARADQVTESGGVVSSLTDLTGSGNHFTASGSARPTYLSSVAEIASKPALRGDGTDDAMTSALALVAPATTDCLIQVFCQQRSYTNGERLINGIVDGVSSSHIIQQGSSTPTIRQASGSNESVNSGLALNTWGLVEALFTNSIDDYTLARAQLVGGIAAGNNISNGGVRLFGSHVPDAFGAFDVAEVLIWFGVPHLLDLSRIGAYLVGRYGTI